MFTRKLIAVLYSTITSVVFFFLFLTFIAAEYVFSSSFPFLFTGYATGNLIGALFIALPLSLLIEWLVNKIPLKSMHPWVYYGSHFLLCYLILMNDHYIVAFFFSIFVTATILYYDHLLKNTTFWSAHRKIHWSVLGGFFLIWIVNLTIFINNPSIPAIVVTGGQ